ncbi:MAG: AAA family ATPase [Burkholderiaceae bacterium]
MTLKQFLSLLAARWWLLVAVFAVVVAAMLAYTSQQPRIYSASAQVIVDAKSPDGSPQQLPEGYLSTQAQLITSERVAIRVVETLKLDQRPEFGGGGGGAAGAAAAGGAGTAVSGSIAAPDPEALKRSIAARLARDVQVKPVRESSALTISMFSRDDSIVADIANAFMNNFIEVTREIRAAGAKQGGTVLEAETERLRVALDKAQADLAGFEKTRKVDSSNTEGTLARQRMQQMANELAPGVRSRGARDRVAVARASVPSFGADSQDVMRNPLVHQLLGDRQRIQQRMADRGRNIGPEHPEMQGMRAELASVERRLRNAVSTSVATLVRELQLLRRRENDVRTGLEKQRGRVVDAKSQVDEANNLRRDVDLARRAYEESVQRLNQEKIKSRTVDANLVPISLAQRPTLPSSPNFARNGSIGVVLGALLGLGAVIFLEAMRPKVRIPDDLARVARAPVIGVLPKLSTRTLAMAGADAGGGAARLGYRGGGGGSGRGSDARRLGHSSSRGRRGAGDSRSEGRGAARADAGHARPDDAGSVRRAGAGATGAAGRPAAGGSRWTTPEPEAPVGRPIVVDADGQAVTGDAIHADSPSAGGDLAARVKADTGHPVLDALVDAGLISTADVPEIEQTAEREGVRIGDAAVATGLVTGKQFRTALARSHDYPLLDPDESVVSHEVFAAFDVNHPFLDDLRRLRSQLKARWFGGAERRERPGRSLAVLSDGRGEGKTFTATNLAVSFTQMGEATLLIDADMWGGRIHEVFGLDNTDGLSTLLSRQCNPRDVFRDIPGMDGLTVIPSGPEVPNASDLLAGHTFDMLLELFEKAFDVIIIDTPSADGKPDASLAAAKAGGYIVVARENQTLTKSMAALVRGLEPMGARLVGTVLVRA